ncbi:HAD family hydrolase [Pseudomonas asiatica]|uniref:HAD family hydrolase n=1 Tax=Pseudomonas asiatica TaxID=2219225 RepID=UPI00209B0649|nr:HAD family hydrolase [Pseudomonas asiatica]MCO7536173.1 HAD family hydrolase [Pseudomonas asiatica]MCO7548695.1 HAD family hydrolase [Pseudomonas asiatica]MCO7560840.1 HAD family hydrolase [Pseudomonas asiatica]
MKKLVITDVDNTLFDWQRLWYECFSAMSEKAIEISGIDADQFYAECSSLHQLHGTSEYSFVLTELPSFQKMYGRGVREAMEPAIAEFRKARASNLKLYGGVSDTLDTLKKRGVTIAAFTESKAYYTNSRFRKLGLDGKIDFLYSPKDHELPTDKKSEYSELESTQHLFTPEGEFKPNPHILLSIVEQLGFKVCETIYIGDNLLKDVYMAQQAEVLDVYAQYGAAQHRAVEYDLLKKVTHWTPEMVEREKQALRPGAVSPTFVAKKSFEEIIDVMERENG